MFSRPPNVSSQATAAARQITKFKPLFDRVLVERFAAETKTKSGIMLPEKAAGKVLDAKVVAVGPGARNDVSFLFNVAAICDGV